jgi:hypothetical protein
MVFILFGGGRLVSVGSPSIPCPTPPLIPAACLHPCLCAAPRAPRPALPRGRLPGPRGPGDPAHQVGACRLLWAAGEPPLRPYRGPTLQGVLPSTHLHPCVAALPRGTLDPTGAITAIPIPSVSPWSCMHPHRGGHVGMNRSPCRWLCIPNLRSTGRRGSCRRRTAARSFASAPSRKTPCASGGRGPTTTTQGPPMGALVATRPPGPRTERRPPPLPPPR